MKKEQQHIRPTIHNYAQFLPGGSQIQQQWVQEEERQSSSSAVGGAWESIKDKMPVLRKKKKSTGPSATSDNCAGVVKAQFMTAKMRSRIDLDNDGVLGVQPTNDDQRKYNSIAWNGGGSLISNKFMMYNQSKRLSCVLKSLAEEVEEVKEMDGEEEDISYVRKPNLTRIVEEYQAMLNHPKYNLKHVVLSRRFHLYAHRFANAQYCRTLVYPTLRQPREMFSNPDSCPWLSSQTICGDCKEEEEVTEKQRTRDGHRFIIAADTQYGILME